MEKPQDMQDLVGKSVVFDTMGTMIYLGVLEEVTQNGFWLAEADVHDCRDGHARREVYIMDSARDGISVNRRRVFVLRETVCSVSSLEHVVAE